MIKKLKQKFVFLATLSMFLLMTLLVGIMNIINYTTVVSEADVTIGVVSQLEERDFEDRDFSGPVNDNAPYGMPEGPRDRLNLHGMSPEVPYESRFFTAEVSLDGEILGTDVSRIVSVDSATVGDYVSAAVKSSQDRGFIGDFRYLKVKNEDAIRIVFLDCGRKLDAFRSFLWTSAAIGLLGIIIVFVVFLVAAGRIIRPISESYVKQRRFITDAGHEIKTPLTIIGANIDLLEDDLGEENECLADIRQQTKRLTELTNDLVYLSKMEESENSLQMVEFPISELVAETAGDFRALAVSQNKEFTMNIQPSLSAVGSPDAIRQMVSIFLENAMKYSPQNGRVSIDLSMQKKTILLSVYNTSGETIQKEHLDHLFDRFYRADASRNSSTGGYGIGLSIAQAIAAAHRGRITAETNRGTDFRITASLPQ